MLPTVFRVRLEFEDEGGAEALRVVHEAIKARDSGGGLAERIMILLARGAAPSGSVIARELGAGKGAVCQELDRLLGEERVVRRAYRTSFMWSLAEEQGKA